MTDGSKNMYCTHCGHPYDPMMEYCIKCGKKLPLHETVRGQNQHEASGVDSGIEPDPDHLSDEPMYEGGHGAEFTHDNSAQGKNLPKFGEIPERSDKGKLVNTQKDSVSIVDQYNGCAVGILIVLSLLFPMIGVITIISWAFMKPYRRAILPGFIATIIGIIIWGWVIWGNLRAGMYDEPYKALAVYLVAQSESNDVHGHYMSLMELKRNGFLRSDFPGDSNTEFEIVEHVLGPSGFLVEVRMGEEETKFFLLKSLWTDQTGEIRMGSKDGPRFTEY